MLVESVVAIVLLTVVIGIAARWAKIESAKNEASYRHVAAEEVLRNAAARLRTIPVSQLQASDWKDRIGLEELLRQAESALPGGMVDVSIIHEEASIDTLRFDIVVSWQSRLGVENRKELAVSGWRFAPRGGVRGEANQ
ncbi:hypothetical protein JCM19992_19540 [Thermostilla marina]